MTPARQRAIRDTARRREAVGLLADALALSEERVGRLLTPGGSAGGPPLRDCIDALLAGRSTLPGVGPGARARLAAALNLARLLAEESLLSRARIRCPADCIDYLHQHYLGYDREVFLCLFLDSRNAIIASEELFHGTVDAAAVYPRVVAARALALGAVAVIVAHNHPSGSSSPSDSDRRITRRLADALALVDVRLLDHLVVGHGSTTSLAELGEC